MREAKTTRYRSVAVSIDHPLARDSGNGKGKVYKHRLVLFDKIGPLNHNCHWCNRLIRWGDKGGDTIVVDHLDGNEWNNTPNNLVPSCRRCNIQRSIRDNFLTHCPKGHEYAVCGIYTRLDGGGRMCNGCSKQRQQKRRTTNNRTRIKRYIECPICKYKVRVEENGKVSRHTFGVAFIKKHEGKPSDVCPASNKQVLERVDR